MSRDETRSFIERRHELGFEIWAAEHKADGAVIGSIGLDVLGWLPEVMPAVEVGWLVRTLR